MAYFKVVEPSRSAGGYEKGRQRDIYVQRIKDTETEKLKTEGSPVISWDRLPVNETTSKMLKEG